MNNKKAFTLIELLAVIVILGVIMIIAIPSVTSYITNARKDSYLSDARMFLNAAKTMLTADATLPQEAGAKVVVPISDIVLDKGGEKSPYGNDWDYENSFVQVENIGTSSDPFYVWKVALNDNKNNCVPLTSMGDLKRELVGTNCEILNPLRALHNKILKEAVFDGAISEHVSSSSGIDFNVPPSDTNGRGLYIRKGTENDVYPIYYYRGNVENNNVIFAGFCWKIVRTTETGGTKIIYNGRPDGSGSCNSTGASSLIGNSSFTYGAGDNTYLGYMYGNTAATTFENTHSNSKDSKIKSAIDTWYKNNLINYTSKLEDTVWCNSRTSDKTGTAIGTAITYYGSYYRVGYGAGNKPEPSLVCENVNDRFTVSADNGNGKLTYPIGLLTAEETTLAGNGFRGYSVDNYLSINQHWWLSSPYCFDDGTARGFVFYSSGTVNNAAVNASAGVRPAIVLKAGIEVTGTGDGTSSNPYIIE